MYCIGLTGGIGSGKSSAADAFERLGAAVVDTDAIAHELTAPHGAAMPALRAEFGDAYVTPAGALDRARMRALVFGDPVAKARLEGILHPRIRALWQAQVDQWRKEGVRLGVVVIPLLFETNVARHFDKVVCVACSAPAQQQRLAARGWSPEQIQQRIGAQWPIEKKLTQADFVIWTEGSPDITMTQVDRLLNQA